MNEIKKHLNTLEALADVAVEVELAEGRPTKESRSAATRYHALVSDQLAAMRRAELAQVGEPNINRRPIRTSLMEMAHKALVAEFTRLKRLHPDKGFAHRKLTEVTDDDLRTMIEDIYWSVEHAS
jgi:hypothetical protein